MNKLPRLNYDVCVNILAEVGADNPAELLAYATPLGRDETNPLDEFHRAASRDALYRHSSPHPHRADLKLALCGRMRQKGPKLRQAIERMWKIDAATSQPTPRYEPSFLLDFDFALALVRREGFRLFDLHAQLQNHPNLVLAAVNQNGRVLRELEGPARALRSVNFAAVQQCGEALQYVRGALHDDVALVLRAVAQNGMALRHVQSPLRDDAHVNETAFANAAAATQFVGPTLAANCDFVLRNVSVYPGLLAYVHRSLRTNATIVVAAVQSDGEAIRYALGAPSEDRGLAHMAIARSPHALLGVRGALRFDVGLNLAAVALEPSLISASTFPLPHHQAVVTEACVRNPSITRAVASGPLVNDVAFLCHLVQKNTACYQYLPKGAQLDFRVAQSAVKQNGNVVLNIPHDPDYLMSLGQHFALRLLAVRQNGLALKYIPSAFFGVASAAQARVLRAEGADGWYQFNSIAEEGESDEMWLEFSEPAQLTLTIAAVRQNKNALAFASPILRNHPQVLRAARGEGEGDANCAASA